VCASAYAQVREPAVAGQFYPGTRAELTQFVDDYLKKAPARNPNQIPIALIAPHAGYVFSGQVAAYSYKQLDGLPIDTVIILGIAHSYPLKGAAIYPKGVYRTPLGDALIDEDAAQKLMKKSGDFQANESAHEGEHSIETHVPFIQRVLPNAKIVPILMGNPDFATAKRIGEAIADLILEEEKNGKRIVIVASTDMAHYPNAKDANESDDAILKTIETNNPEALVSETNRLMSKGIHELHCTLCGEGPTLAVMSAAKKLGANQGTILKHATSADSPFGEPLKTVGYCAVAFFKSSSESPKMFSKEQEKKLLRIARSAMTRFVTNKDKSSLAAQEKDPVFQNPAAVFVTLMKNGELRGCIGGIEPKEALAVAVEKSAISAATEDPRFNPVTSNELSQISIEISVLSSTRPVKSADEIIPNKHGVIIERGGYRGLFLPQVWEHVKGDKEKFMNLLASEKAGLPQDAWKDPKTKLSIFEVFSFDEKK